MIDYNEYTAELRAAAQHLEDALEILTRVDYLHGNDGIRRSIRIVKAAIDRRDEDPRAKVEESKPEPVPVRCKELFLGASRCTLEESHGTPHYHPIMGRWS